MSIGKGLAKRLEPRLTGYTNFKIGKTGQIIGERFDQEYSKDYNYYDEIMSSPNAEIVDSCERDLIEYFFEFPNCDNDQIGGGEMAESEWYIVYIVYNA